MLQTKEGKSLGELFRELTQEMSTLMRQEVQLAKTEMTQKVTGLVKDLGLLIAGGIFAFVGFQALVATAIIALAGVLPAWLAALIVTAVLLILGGILIAAGLASLKKADAAPRQTIETIKEDAEWAKQQMK